MAAEEEIRSSETSRYGSFSMGYADVGAYVFIAYGLSLFSARGRALIVCLVAVIK